MFRRFLINLTLLTMLAHSMAGIDRGVLAQTTGGRLTEAVSVSIRPACSVNSPVVRLSDVAWIDSADGDLKAQVEMFDIADTPGPGESMIVSPSLIEFRLRLAGIHRRRISIHGRSCQVIAGSEGIQIPTTPTPSWRDRRSTSDEMILTRATMAPNNENSRSSAARDAAGSTVGSPGRSTIRTTATETRSIEELIILSGRNCVLEQLPWNEEDVTIRVVQPVGRDLQATEPARELVLTAERHGAGPPVGRVQVNVTIERADHSTFVVPVTFDVRHFDTVVAASKAIPKGREIQVDDLYAHRADVTSLAEYCSNPRKLAGTTTRRLIPALQIIRDQDVETVAAAPGKSGPVVIKRQDRVKMIAKIGDLNITVSGEAQQEGRVGEMIRILNVESKAIVQARVVRANEVEIVE